MSLLTLCCWFSFFHSSHPLFISSSLLLGSLLTLLNVRAQTSPCRAAPSHRGQKQLVSLPFPCFLAASVCLTVCLLLPVPCHTPYRSFTVCHRLELRYTNTCKRQSYSMGRNLISNVINSTCRVLAPQEVDFYGCNLETLFYSINMK